MKDSLTVWEQEKERTACRVWIEENNGYQWTAVEREIAEKAWIARAALKKGMPFLSEEEKTTVLNATTLDEVVFNLSQKLGYPVMRDDPLLISALAGVILHEKIQSRNVLLVERLIERMERYESATQDVALEIRESQKKLIDSLLSKLKEEPKYVILFLVLSVVMAAVNIAYNIFTA
ncbi:hypothetical protein P5U49_000168 [Neisseria gonorrhoeae]